MPETVITQEEIQKLGDEINTLKIKLEKILIERSKSMEKTDKKPL